MVAIMRLRLDICNEDEARAIENLVDTRRRNNVVT